MWGWLIKDNMPVFSSLCFPSTQHMLVSVYDRAVSPSLPLSGTMYQGPTTAQHQVCRICNTGGPFRVLPTQCLWFHEIVSTLCFAPLLNIWAMTQKRRNIKEDVPAARVLKKILSLVYIHAERPWNLSKTKPHQDRSPLLTFLYYLSGFWLPFCDLFSPSWLPKICFPWISPV